ncbi:prepilin-type N-terminal cleavage/methylation domain-containing protein [Acidithiobacillus sp. HP-6]|uniref:prepilin-type N-terminal cleavage/methylation domain-containing protein n=1 Tax=unclassified Acidithiobacillus TaxID=2614800 RepID=UPI0018799083|nr:MULTISPECIES: prepilin-type N-terminal cleavage/methylation domain-containing protein [unclassified Acidithiobacillus]MBE7564431.1 prepilin-type N-terminal cleavage/methylation domain-containing protein [Acidithiobacillus sp. HP-6]MBE7570385.1 prepilin-type N-terminal cleavage/methylation domain-containing protein [Acidithiobacillus sp. HP-2]
MQHQRDGSPAVWVERGFTLIQLLIAIAILAIVAAIAIPNWTEEVQQSGYQTTLEEGQSAVRMLNLMALQGQGAVLVQNGTALTISANSGAQWSGNLPQNGQLFLNGNQLTCVSLNGMGIPANDVTAPDCSANPSGILQWSVSYTNKAPIAITSSVSGVNAYD